MISYNVWVTVKYTVDDEEGIDDTVWDVGEALRDASIEPDEITSDYMEADEA